MADVKKEQFEKDAEATRGWYGLRAAMNAGLYSKRPKEAPAETIPDDDVARGRKFLDPMSRKMDPQLRREVE